MTRPGVLRIGYGALGVGFLALAASASNPGLLFVALGLALVGAIVLVFSRDDLPKWAGITLLAFFVLLVLAFFAATPITVRKGGSYSLLPLAPDLAKSIMDYLGLGAPVMLAATTLAAAWERERAPRLLLLAAVGGSLLYAILSIATAPAGNDAAAVAKANASFGLASLVLAASALAAAAGALWSAARPEEFG